MRSFKVTLEVTRCDDCPWSSYDHVTDLSSCNQTASMLEGLQAYSENCWGITDSCPVAHLHEEF